MNSILLIFSGLSFFSDILHRGNMALICLGVYYYHMGNCEKDFKKACVFYTVCTKYIYVALAAYVPILWETFKFCHSCKYTVILSKNVST